MDVGVIVYHLHPCCSNLGTDLRMSPVPSLDNITPLMRPYLLMVLHDLFRWSLRRNGIASVVKHVFFSHSVGLHAVVFNCLQCSYADTL